MMTDAKAKRINGYLELEIGRAWVLMFHDGEGTRLMFQSTLDAKEVALVLEKIAASLRERPQATRMINTDTDTDT